MPIDASWQTDPDKPRYGLPLDSCVGDGVGDPHAGGKPAPKPSAAAMGPLRGGSVTAGGSRGKAVAQSGVTPPVGYDGP